MARRAVYNRLAAAAAVASLVACGSDSPAGAVPDGAGLDSIRAPLPSEWTARGAMFTAGSPGDWDLYLGGGFANGVVKHGGTYSLYYQGSDGYDDVEETVTHRAIGVATSPDGLSFAKSPSNPVVSWLPTPSIEEGAASGGAFVTAAGEVAIVYGANTEVSAGLVEADGRYTVSGDGLTFADQGVALDHTDRGVWGSGDELFPVLGIDLGGSVLVYYIPNGTAQRGQLGVASGASVLALDATAPVTVGGTSVAAWGPASSARLSAARHAVFVNNDADAHAGANHIDVYEVDPENPARFIGPVQTYAFAEFSRGVVLLDEATSTWFLYHRNGDASAYRVMTAPVRTSASP